MSELNIIKIFLNIYTFIVTYTHVYRKESNLSAQRRFSKNELFISGMNNLKFIIH